MHHFHWNFLWLPHIYGRCKMQQQGIVWRGRAWARSRGGQQGHRPGSTGAQQAACYAAALPPPTITTNRLDLPHERLEKTLPLTLCSAVHLALPGACPQGKERSCSDASKPCQSLLGGIVAWLPAAPPWSNHCPFLWGILSTSLRGTLIFSCGSSRQRRPGDLKADFRVPYKDFPWDRQSGQAASQGYILHHLSLTKCWAFAFLDSSDAFLKV